MEVLELFGFGPTFRKWIELLYRAPVAQKKLNSKLSSSFPIQRGKRQGQALSSTLFALVMGSLEEVLRASALVVEIRIGSFVEKLALYANDSILFPRDPGPSLLEALQILALRPAYQLGKVSYPPS